jgi:hypothetical protein
VNICKLSEKIGGLYTYAYTNIRYIIIDVIFDKLDKPDMRVDAVDKVINRKIDRQTADE